MKKRKICVVGLGYVGLPLVVEFGKRGPAVGFDSNAKRVTDLRKGLDANSEVPALELRRSDILFTTDPNEIGRCNFVIVCVPTPVDKHKIPDLGHVRSASEIVGRHMSKGTIVVFESTVYPGVTEEICAPILERTSELRCGRDFKIGYSPERVNPGDKEHTISRITKVVSGMDKTTLDEVARVYSSIVKAGVYKAPSIKTAEAAKVIENIQRDLNIALMNELSLIFEKLGLRTSEVLAAAATKWNFHRYYPGLVGGHCIGVDPYYLTHKALELGYHPRVILAGREINDNMSRHIVELAVRGLNQAGKVLKTSKALVMGVTFKENVADTRNSKIADVITGLQEFHIKTVAFDPLLAGHEGLEFDAPLATRFEDVGRGYDVVIVGAPHRVFKKIPLGKLKARMRSRPVLVDIRESYDRKQAERLGIAYFSL
ncbi:MAG: nucleotide sugar dehydrogenase [Planctomycetota bacterium]